MENKEKQNINPLEQGMLNPNGQQIVNKKNEKVQSSSAEDVLGTVAKVVISIGSIICGIGALVGLAMFLSNLGDGGYFSNNGTKRITGLIILGASILIYIPTLVSWATLKMQVNMSRNLFVIKEILLKMQNKQS